jgi:hypothetical protein
MAGGKSVVSKMARERITHRMLGGAAIVGTLIVLVLIATGVARHPEGLGGSGRALLLTDVGLLLACGVAAAWVWRQRDPRSGAALRVGAVTGVLLGAVAVANHSIELFAPAQGRIAQFVLGAGPVLLMIGLFAATGSAARERTRSVTLGALAGVWCAVVALLMLLSFAFASNLVFEALAESRLQEAFAASGMSDPGAFLVKNSLEAGSEHLVRMPALALLLSILGGVANAVVTGRSRRITFALASVTPLMFVLGAFALWYASSLERAARPPFVIVGALAAAVALSAIHPIWSALRRVAHKGKAPGLIPGPSF